MTTLQRAPTNTRAWPMPIFEAGASGDAAGLVADNRRRQVTTDAGGFSVDWHRLPPL